MTGTKVKAEVDHSLISTNPDDHVVLIKQATLRTDVSPPPQKSLLFKTPLNRSRLLCAFAVTACFTFGMLLYFVYASAYNNGLKWPQIDNTKCMQHKTVTKANVVTLQYITGRGTDVPFRTFTDLLSEFAVKYPNLKFEVQFYLSDTSRDYVKFKNGWSMTNLQNRMNIIAFMHQYKNVVVIFKPLSQLMTLTPLKYIWEFVPMRHLTFYAGVYEVWKNGGIAFDLEMLAKKYDYGKPFGTRIETLIQRFNDGHDILYSDVFEKPIDLSFFFMNDLGLIDADVRLLLNVEQLAHPLRFKRQTSMAVGSIANDKANEMNMTHSSNNNTEDTNMIALTDNVVNITLPSNSTNTSETAIELKTSASVIDKLLIARHVEFFPVMEPQEYTMKDLYMKRDGLFVASKIEGNPFLSKILCALSCIVPSGTEEIMGISTAYIIGTTYMDQCRDLKMCDRIHFF